MEKTTFLGFENLYHVYNRGTNKQTIFFDKKDYERFLFLWEKYTDSIIDTYAYCLLPNHFHFLIKIKPESEIKKTKKVENIDNEQLKYFLSKQLSNLFNAYSKYFNIKYERVGKVFCERFKRKEITSDAYFTILVQYIHRNPQKHGITEDFKDYEYSSYWLHLLDQRTRLKNQEILNWFGSKKEYELLHSTYEVELT